MPHSPRKTPNRRLFKTFLALACLVTSLICGPAAHAAGGGGGGGAPSPLTFTVNVGPFSRAAPMGGGILQASLVLHATAPEALHEIDLYKPMVIHHIHLTINSFSIDELRSIDGKDNLADAIIERINKVLRLEEKKGIEDVFFTSFILQSN